MISRLLLFGCGILLVFNSCSKRSIAHPDEVAPVVVQAPTPYKIVETFETGIKGAYAAADLILLTGSWNFNDALIGNLATDKKEGLKSMRLRTGSVNMNFDVRGLKMLYISHAKFGTDANTSWQLQMSVNGGAYTQIGNDVLEDNTNLKLDSFAITVTEKVRFKIVNTSTARINIDNITFKGTGDPGIVVGEPDTGVDEGTAAGGIPNIPRDVVAGTDAPPLMGDNGNILLGNPSEAQINMLFADNYLIDHKYFVESYSSSKAIPNWVSWHLDAANIGSAPRQDNFAAWSGLPSGWFQVQSNSYNYATYGFDRGHNCPSADRTSSTEANSSTFLMTNMIPQSSTNNQGVWSNFENYLRSLVLSGNEVYVVMGNYGAGGTSSKGAFSKIGNITIPAFVWKVAVVIPAGTNDLSRISSDSRVIAINTPNTHTVNPDWTQYIVTVRDIETETKFNILSGLPRNIQDIVEIRKDSGK
ncbi:MAG TPA: DNA/RNA non-specific endonuclease [Sphingobacteriaceae bacterium]|nr:DNA/RNA non-specific endonuclease [Sphingobacteriaceae bacterium]